MGSVFKIYTKSDFFLLLPLLPPSPSPCHLLPGLPHIYKNVKQECLKFLPVLFNAKSSGPKTVSAISYVYSHPKETFLFW